MDQHQLITAILIAAGGVEPEALLPPGYAGKRADIVFPAEAVIAEIKSLASDRTADEALSARIIDLVAAEAARGTPIPIYGGRVRLHDLPPPLAERILRLVGKRVRKEISVAARQIAATRQALAMPGAYGLIVVVTPPGRIGNASIGWLINDVMKQTGTGVGIDGAFIIETALGHDPDARVANSFSSLFSVSDRNFPDDLRGRIGAAWERETGQRARPGEFEAFVSLGATE